MMKQGLFVNCQCVSLVDISGIYMIPILRDLLGPDINLIIEGFTVKKNHSRSECYLSVSKWIEKN